MKIEAILDGLSLTLRGNDLPKKESLSLDCNYPLNPLSQFLFAQLGLMHLLAPHTPREVKANFSVHEKTRQLIAAMYAYEGRPVPNILAPQSSIRFSLARTDPGKVAIAYSAGKDSMWNLWWASERLGMENVLPVHVKGLNPIQTSQEYEYVMRQFITFGIKNYDFIWLSNGSRNSGFDVMRSRQIFLTALIIPVALDFGASQILIEGFAEESKEDRFTGRAQNIRFFNQTLHAWRIPIRITWCNTKEMDHVRDLYQNRPEWMQHVCNCFTRKNYQKMHRGYMVRSFPTLPLYDSQCGLCIKCRIVNLGRMLYDPQTHMAPDEAHTYLQLTAKWIKTKMPTHRDMIEGSFLRDFKKLARRYGVRANLAAARKSSP